MHITALLHVTFIVDDLARAQRFYQHLLGLIPDESRPAMSFDGVWYSLGGQQIHLMQLPNPEAGLQRPAHGGRDRHVALAVDNMDNLIQQLNAAGIAYTLSLSGRKALFCRDPDENALEFVEAL